MIIADSDVLIDALRGREEVARRIELELETGNLATTAITVFELLSGAKSARERAKVEALLGAMNALPLDALSARRAGEVRRDLEARGEKLAPADFLIAGICLTRSAILLTRNRKHFERIDGLVLGRL